MYSLVIADDEMEIRNGLSRYIAWNQIGFECVATAENGEQAIDLIHRFHPDVALCDIRMPVKSGIDVARYVFENKLPTIVVLLSAYRDFEYARSAMAYDVHYYIVKSARNSEMIEVFDGIRRKLSTRAPQTNEDALLREIKRCIANNLRTASLESISEMVGRHPSSVSQYFKNGTGMLFSQYMTQERMQYAVKLLADVRLHIYEISDMTGYANAQNFSRTFRQYYGITPREYRLRQGIDLSEEP